MRIFPSQSTRHEPERGVHRVVDHGEIQPVALGNRRPVVNAGAAERIDAHANVRAANRVHVDDIGRDRSRSVFR